MFLVEMLTQNLIVTDMKKELLDIPGLVGSNSGNQLRTGVIVVSGMNTLPCHF